MSGGYSPALGFVHTGKQLSFVYDIADLYKAELTIPIAFQVVSEGTVDIEKRARQYCRDAFRERKLLQRILPDIDSLLGINQDAEIYPSDDDPALPEPWWQPDVGEEGEERENT